MSENPASQPAEAERTAHLDGLRVRHGAHDAGRLSLDVELWAGGRPAPHLMTPVLMWEGPDDETGRACQDRNALLLRALCDYCNSGGSANLAAAAARKFAERVTPLFVPYKLVSVLPPPGGNTLVWARPDGKTFLRVVEGEDGFVEPLTRDQLDDVVREALPPDPEPDLPV